MEEITVGLMVGDRKKRKSFLRKYSRYTDLSLRLISFTPDDIDWKHNTVSALRLDQGVFVEGTEPLPQAVYNRCYRDKRKILKSLEQRIGTNKTFNSINRFNKWKVYTILNESNIRSYLPLTNPYDPESLTTALQNESLLFLKPCLGHYGNGVFRLERVGDEIMLSEHSLPPRNIWGRSDPQLTDQIKELLQGKKYMIQRGIDLATYNGFMFDIRVLVQKNRMGAWEVGNMACRVAYADYYNASCAGKAENVNKVLNAVMTWMKARKTIHNMKSVSVQAASELEKNFGLLGELSVDFGLDKKGAVWIIEVNGKPQKNIFSTAVNREAMNAMYRRPLEHARFLTENGSG